MRQNEGRLPRYKLILNPTDGSTTSERATAHAIYLAKETGAELVVLHVVETTIVWYTGTLYQQMVDRLREFGNEVLKKALKRAKEEGVVARSMMIDGHSGTVIVRVAEREGADLIVMGTHGRTGFVHNTLGSTAERVVQRAGCPVLVVRPK
jgi:nucleotide-binding universal stress UspA family protein